MKQNFQTEVGLLAIWDSKSLSYIDTLEQYQANFVEDASMITLMNDGKAVIWGTGGDGSFSIDVRVNPKEAISADEEKIIELSAKDLELVVTSDLVYFGSPEAVGTVENQSLTDGLIKKVEGLEIGKYSVDLYFLFDSEAIEKDLSSDKTGYIVILKKVSDDHIFPTINELPQLG